VLTAEREVWVNCRNCKHKTQAPVPDWSARLKSLQLLLEQGWGRPEPATPDATDDERLEAAVEERLILMEEERYKQVAPLAEHEREILSWPMAAQLAVLQLQPDELADVMAKRGLRHALDNLGGTEGLAEWLGPVARGAQTLLRSLRLLTAAPPGGPLTAQGHPRAIFTSRSMPLTLTRQVNPGTAPRWAVPVQCV